MTPLFWTRAGQGVFEARPTKADCKLVRVRAMFPSRSWCAEVEWHDGSKTMIALAPSERTAMKTCADWLGVPIGPCTRADRPRKEDPLFALTKKLIRTVHFEFHTALRPCDCHEGTCRDARALDEELVAATKEDAWLDEGSA